MEALRGHIWPFGAKGHAIDVQLGAAREADKAKVLSRSSSESDIMGKCAGKLHREKNTGCEHANDMRS